MLRVVGAGLPRTGTMSLKHALERLLGAPCYHMTEVFAHPEDAKTWADLLAGESTDWDACLNGYVAAVDWPASRLWRDLAASNPDALVLLSVRDSGEQWWRSVSQTILPRMRQAAQEQRPPGAETGASQPPGAGGQPQQAGPLADADPEQLAGVGRMFQRLVAIDGFADAIEDMDTAAAWYDRYVDEVRADVPASRLLEWKAADGWEPLCEALGVPVPDEPFPRLNSTEEFVGRLSQLEQERRAQR